jgi:glutaredoxin
LSGAGSPPRPRVVLYGRPGCHLCEEARRLLAQLAEESPGFVLAEIDIDSDERLLGLFLERIPVIEIEGEVVSELVPDRELLRARLGTVGT